MVKPNSSLFTPTYISADFHLIAVMGMMKCLNALDNSVTIIVHVLPAFLKGLAL